MKTFKNLICLFFTLFLFTGCALNQGENRKVTAWGIWALVAGNPIGVGYWHSERGPDVKSEMSAKPKIP